MKVSIRRAASLAALTFSVLSVSLLSLSSCRKPGSDSPASAVSSAASPSETIVIQSGAQDPASESTGGPEDAALVYPIENYTDEAFPEGSGSTSAPSQDAEAGTAAADEEAARTEASDDAFADAVSFDPEMVPLYACSPSVTIHGNIPFFTENDETGSAYLSFSDLDELGRCGTAMACLGPETLAEMPRGDIMHIHPSGWQNAPYDSIEGGYLYNRCHLIGYDLSGENDNERNLITGTRFLNKLGMLPYEIRIGSCIRNYGMHVLYRVTPVFEDDDLLASGVLMEARSLEDDGKMLTFCVYCYNVQPGFILDYRTGAHRRVPESESGDTEMDYVLNIRSHRFHYPGCDSLKNMNPANRVDFHGARKELIGGGYKPCNACRP